MRPIAVSLLFVLLAGTASAGDGVLEINQSCAVNTGCFSGDTAGFPITISATGSYRLTGSLTVPDENTNAIVISASSVEIDLNGFAIVGPTSCTGFPVTCTPSTGTGTGIGIASISVIGVAVENGSIRGMGLRGVDLGDYSIVEDLRVSSTRATGIDVGVSSIVRNNVVRIGNVGISTGAGAVVLGNAVSGGSTTGIFTSSGSTISGNSAYENQGDGISTSSGSTVVGNLSHSNGGDGIQTTQSSSVQRNMIRENGGFGLKNIVNLAPTAYRNNTITSNISGTVTDSVNLGGNNCDNTATCP